MMPTIRGRIYELVALSSDPNWDFAPLSKAGLVWLEVQLTKACVAGLPMPWIYPTPDGNVQLEWLFGTWAPSLEINVVHRTGYFHTCDVAATDGDHSTRDYTDIDLHDPEGWAFVIGEVEQDRKAAWL